MEIKDKSRKVSLKELRRYKNNTKIHSEEQIIQLKKSIEKYGYIQPIVVDDKNVIVSGHGRYEALLLINPKKVIEVVDVSYLSKREIKKLRLLDNKIVSNKYDANAIQKEIDSIYTNGYYDEEYELLTSELDQDINKLLESQLVEETTPPKEEKLKPFKKMHFLFSFDVSSFNRYKSKIEELAKMKGVEVEQSSN
jgi:ParB-like chromosome segregation protein Spo0J